MGVKPNVSVTLPSKIKDSNGRALAVDVSLTGKTLRLRGGLLNNVSVDLDELKEAIGILEKHAKGLEK